MKRSRLLIATGYWLAFLLVVLPLLEPIVTLLPPRPEQVRWRLEAFGALSQALLLPLAGGVVAVVTAVLLGHRRVVRVLGGIAIAAGGALVVAMALFALDLVEYRAAIDAELRKYYQVAGVIYFISYILGTAFLFVFGITAWLASARSRRRSRRSGDALVHGPQPQQELTP
jgi:hypothetical protein